MDTTQPVTTKPMNEKRKKRFFTDKQKIIDFHVNEVKQFGKLVNEKENTALTKKLNLQFTKGEDLNRLQGIRFKPQLSLTLQKIQHAAS